jgi:RNA polymerase sigma-70 factor (ECF subfamily)
VGRFFDYYAKYPRVRLEPAWLEDREILLVVTDAAETPSYFMLVEWQDHKITLIRDHRYATYVMEGADVMAASPIE